MHLKTSDVPSILDTMYKHRREMVPCFIGAPGIGKTQGIYEFAKSRGVKVVTFILSNTVPSEVSGIRMPDRDTKQLEVFDDARMASLEDGDILFFDELLEAPPMLWSAILTLVQDRIMASGRKLPDVMIVAASNQVASPQVIPPSTRDRFMWCELEFDFDTWKDWFAAKYKYEIPKTLRHHIQQDSDGYNILTPRRFVKLFEYYKDQPGDVTRKIIESMFDESTAGYITLTLENPVRGAVNSERICKELEAEGISLPEEWQRMSLKELFAAIDKLDNADDIKEKLSNKEV